jgi:pimeloyl-ACP methyl ester carboxylesterase
MKKGILAAVVAFLALFFSLATFAAENAVTITTQDGVALSGLIEIPSGQVRGAVVLLSGSGNVGMDGDVSSPLVGFGYKGAPAKLNDQLAAALSAKGIASLRYAKRGFEDPSQLVNQIAPFLVKDALSALSLIQSRFPGVKSGFVGFSEGALISLLAANQKPVDVLFLLGLPTRHPDSWIRYQFLEWPMALLRGLDLDQDGELSAEELAILGEPGLLPLINLAGAPWRSLDANLNNSVSLSTEVQPAYEGTVAAVMGLLETPAYAGWFNSFRELPSFPELAKTITAPVFLYHAKKDAQISWNWVTEDYRWFAGPSQLRSFDGLGHCFAPMEGPIGQTKTSGPFDQTLLEALTSDAAAVFLTTQARHPTR